MNRVLLRATSITHANKNKSPFLRQDTGSKCPTTIAFPGDACLRSPNLQDPRNALSLAVARTAGSMCGISKSQVGSCSPRTHVLDHAVQHSEALKQERLMKRTLRCTSWLRILLSTFTRSRSKAGEFEGLVGLVLVAEENAGGQGNVICGYFDGLALAAEAKATSGSPGRLTKGCFHERCRQQKGMIRQYGRDKSKLTTHSSQLSMQRAAGGGDLAAAATAAARTPVCSSSLTRILQQQ